MFAKLRFDCMVATSLNSDTFLQFSLIFFGAHGKVTRAFLS